MERIKINENYSINIDFSVQVGKLNRPFQHYGLRKNTDMPSKFINQVECFHWIYEFKYLDKQGGKFEIEIDYYNNIVKNK